MTVKRDKSELTDLSPAGGPSEVRISVVLLCSGSEFVIGLDLEDVMVEPDIPMDTFVDMAWAKCNYLWI